MGIREASLEFQHSLLIKLNHGLDIFFMYFLVRGVCSLFGRPDKTPIEWKSATLQFTPVTGARSLHFQLMGDFMALCDGYNFIYKTSSWNIAIAQGNSNT